MTTQTVFINAHEAHVASHDRYVVAVERATNSLGMRVEVYHILRNGVTAAETHDEGRALFIADKLNEANYPVPG